MASNDDTPFSWVRNVEVETDTPVDGVVTGQVPEWLEGTLIRNGSGIYKVGETTLKHLFDGMAVLHRFNIHQGKVTYQNRILQSDNYVSSKEANRLTVGQFATVAGPDPCKSLLGRFMSRFGASTPSRNDNCSVNICYFGDALYAMTETINLRRIDPNTLDVIGPAVHVNNYVAVNHSTAHPHVDEDGTVYNMGNSKGEKGPTYNIVQFPPGTEYANELGSFTEAKIVATFPSRWKFHPSYYHSFGMTENYFVFMEMPLAINGLKAMNLKLLQISFEQTLEWYPKEKVRFYLVDRKTGKVVDTVYEAPGFFCFHHSNAYEKDGHVVIDISHIKDGSIIADMMMNRLREKHQDFTNSYYTRFILPLNVKNPEDKSQFGENLIKLSGTRCKSYWSSKTVITCEPDRLCQDHSMELPRINYKYNGKEYRYAYAVCMGDGFAETLKVVKLDVETRETKVWERDGMSVSEPVYVARPDSTEEDDGVILFSALDTKNDKRVLLVILNAATFEEVATAEFTAAGCVSKDFHGVFASQGDRVHRY